MQSSCAVSLCGIAFDVSLVLQCRVSVLCTVEQGSENRWNADGQKVVGAGGKKVVGAGRKRVVGAGGEKVVVSREDCARKRRRRGRRSKVKN